MYKLSRSAWTVLLAVIIILVGLFLVCAQRQATEAANGDDLAVEDDQFKQELLQLLDLTEDSTATKTPSESDVAASTPKADVADASQDDVMALLQAENDSQNKSTEEQPVVERDAQKEQAAQNQLDTTPQTTNDNLGISSDMFSKLKGDVAHLEQILESRSASIDSLRRIVDNRNTRLQDLEGRLASASSGSAMTSDRSGSAAKSAGAARQASSSPDFKSGYQQARDLFEAFKYREAIDAFTRILEQNPDDVLADNSQYWIGECYFGLKEYQQAVMEFQKVFAYSMTDKYDDAQLMIGLSYVRSGQKEKAQKEFETFLNNYGTSEYAGVAKKYYRDI